MLFDELDKLKRSAIMTSIVLMFIGVLLLIIPLTIFDLFNNLLGFALIVTFVVIALDFLTSKKAIINYIIFVFGMILGTLGFVLLIFEAFLISILYILVGLIPIIGGLYGVVHALLFARTSGKKGWWILIILGLVLIAFGVVQFINPWNDTTEGIVKVIGGTLMATSLISGLRLFWLWPIQSSK